MRFFIAFVLTSLITQSSFSQTPAPLRFQWKAGQVHTYAVKQTTAVEEILLAEGTNKPQSGSHTTTMSLAYTWTVTAVDQNSVATIEKMVTTFKSESTRISPGKDMKPETTVDALDSSVAADREKMPFLGKAAVVAKVDAVGNVLDAKSEFGESALTRFKTELPFRMTLTDKPLTPGLSWDRPFAINLDPKYGGTGEQFPTVQKCTFKGMNGVYAVIGVATTLKTPPTGSGVRSARS